MSEKSPKRKGQGGEKGTEQRKHPRRVKKLNARIFRPSHKKKSAIDFEASLSTRDISIGGAFLQSSYFLKVGTKIEIEFELPEIERDFHGAAEVVHVLAEPGREQVKPSGFAIKFTRYFEESEIYLRAYLAEGNLYRFIEGVLKKQGAKFNRKDVDERVELIVRWEMFQETLGKG